MYSLQYVAVYVYMYMYMYMYSGVCLNYRDSDPRIGDIILNRAPYLKVCEWK